MRYLLWLLLAWPAAAAAQTAPPSHLAPNAPPDRPVAVTDTSAATRFFELVAPCVAKARAAYPTARERYLAGLPPQHSFFVSTRLRDAAGRTEQVFVVVDSIRPVGVHGRIWNDIGAVRGYQRGQPHVVLDADVVDWMVARPDGSEEGNYIGKFIDEYRRRGTPPMELCAPDT